MKAFRVKVNGKRLCLAGVGEIGVLTAIVDYVGDGGSDELSLSVGGLLTAKDEHVRWLRRRKMKVGDRVQIEILNSRFVDAPTGRHRRTPAQVRAETKKYVRDMA